ncbi:RING finger protein 20, putative [Brugia malayi]|uniref:E3 ubiquitin protein ligase n=3 Tax=Brugia malayi TaxID=6279 RepID=A0A5S6PPU9_BRUMA|nr:RING finger protein 20, putative [Brugia malayi]VIO90063.1 RING finger protein 20, putative [Brugia malayi]
MSKRSSPGSDDDSPGASADEPLYSKRRLVEFEPVRICSVSGTSDIDAKVLAVQHYKLSERFRLKERQTTQLQHRVEQLESRQAQDDAMMCTINRFWNLFDENVRTLLQRFDAETAVEGEIKMECEETKSFLAKLAHWDDGETEEKLKQRVEFSRRAISKLIQVFDHITQRNGKIAEMIASCSTADESPDDGASTSDGRPTVNAMLVKRNAELSEENIKLQKMITKLQSENHSLSSKVSAQEDKLTIIDTRKQEMDNSLEEMKYELEKAMRRECKLDFRLAEYVKKTRDLEMNLMKASVVNGPNNTNNTKADSPPTASVNKSKLEELEQNLEIQTDLAASRLQELQEMLDKNKNLTKQVENLKMNLKNIPTEVIRTSIEYTTLQSQFSSLFTEANQMRQQIETAKSQLAALRSAHSKQIEVMESEECQAREQMQDTMNRHEEELYQVRREYEMLRLEFEQNLSANEQSGPLNKEIRLMLASAKAENQQLKQEANRFKRKWKEAVSSLAKCNKELESERRYRERCLLIEIEDDNDALASPDQDRNIAEPSESLLHDGESCEYNSEIDGDTDIGTHPNRVIQKLKKKVADLQLKIDALNALTAEQRERAELLVRERRLKLENDKLQLHIKKLAGADHREKMKYYSDEAQRKIRSLEETADRLRKEAHSARQEEEGLMNDVETTGQAFEEMQEQNTRLLQQLREKDDANLKLMAERIRANQYQKKMSEERERTEERISSLQNQIEAQQLMISKLEETEKLLRQKNSHLEHQLRLIEQANDMHKRKAIECSQTSADYKAQLEKCNSQLNDAQQAVTTKTSQQEVDSFKIKRLEEEKSILRKKLERTKKMEKMENWDEVLNEEIRELKDILTCPSCKVRRKDAVLTKCFHVFCMECMKTRYETRRRKCPKCNAAFGANDYRRMYFT